MNHNKHYISHSLVISTILLSLVLLSSCQGETVMFSSIPSYPVYLEYNIVAEDPHFVPTNTGAYKTFTSQRYPKDALGFAGILIFIGLDAQYHAFDMGCPKCLRRQQPVEVNGIFAHCPVCQEDYDLSYGLATPTHNISIEALKKYNIIINNNTLIVRP